METMDDELADVEKNETFPAFWGLGEGTPPRKRSRHLLLALVATIVDTARAVAATLCEFF